MYVFIIVYLSEKGFQVTSRTQLVNQWENLNVESHIFHTAKNATIRKKKQQHRAIFKLFKFKIKFFVSLRNISEILIKFLRIS